MTSFLVTAAPSCTEYRQAMNRRPPRMDLADAIVHRTLEVIENFQPQRWWLETPRNGTPARRAFMDGYPVLDCEQCCFEELGYQKPNRLFGSDHLLKLSPRNVTVSHAPLCWWTGLDEEGDHTDIGHEWEVLTVG